MKLLKYLYFTLCFIMILALPVNAYLDPSVTTYVVAAVAGAAVAIGAVIDIFWRKAKRKVQDKLGMDENSKKEKEEDVVEFDDV